MNNSKTEPKFHLRIQPSKIIQNFLNGQYDNRNISENKQIETVNYDVVTKFGNSPYDERYILIGRNNIPVIMVTTNQSQFTKNFTNIPENAIGYHSPDKNIKKRCNNCNRKFTHDHVGIPIEMNVYKDKINFSCIGIYHSFGCAYKNIIGNSSIRSVNSINARYVNSETLLKYMFELIHPNKKLIAAKDPLLLNINGGPLTQAEYDDQDFLYRETPNLVFTTVKMEYEQYKA